MQPLERPLTRREEVIEVSRRKYGRPRAEVERMIAEQMGWAKPASNQQSGVTSEISDALKRQLLEVGIDEDRADSLLVDLDRERIRRQLEWLPHRQVRNPIGFLIAAIEHDYEAPYALRHGDASQQPSQQRAGESREATSGELRNGKATQ